MSDPVTIVVPMAGAGARFANAGYAVPKPLINVKGKTMVEWVLECTELCEQHTVILVMQKNLPRHFPSQVERLLNRFSAVPVYARHLTQGAACSVLLARNYFKNGPLVIVDSDTYLKPPVFQDFIADSLARSLDVALLCMPETNPAYSFVALDNYGNITDIVEKLAISCHAVCGAYYFRNAAIFINSLMDLLIYGEKVKNEYYMSNVCKNAVGAGHIGGIFEVDKNLILCMGTPEQLVLSRELL